MKRRDVVRSLLAILIGGSWVSAQKKQDSKPVKADQITVTAAIPQSMLCISNDELAELQKSDVLFAFHTRIGKRASESPEWNVNYALAWYTAAHQELNDHLITKYKDRFTKC